MVIGALMGAWVLWDNRSKSPPTSDNSHNSRTVPEKVKTHKPARSRVSKIPNIPVYDAGSGIERSRTGRGHIRL